MQCNNSERPRSLLLSLGGAIQTLAWVLSWARPGPIPSPRWSRPDSPRALFYSVSDPSRSQGGGHPGLSWSHPAPVRSLQDRAWTGRNRLLGNFRIILAPMVFENAPSSHWSLWAQNPKKVRKESKKSQKSAEKSHWENARGRCLGRSQIFSGISSAACLICCSDGWCK